MRNLVPLLILFSLSDKGQWYFLLLDLSALLGAVQVVVQAGQHGWIDINDDSEIWHETLLQCRHEVEKKYRDRHMVN